jgi:hypothetical protein
MGNADWSWLTPQIEEVQAAHRARVDDLYAGQPVDGVVAIAGRMAGRNHGLWGTNDTDMLRQPEAWLAEVLADHAAHAAEVGDRRTFRPLVVEIDAFGTHYIDALFGAPVHFHGGQVWSETLKSDLAELAAPDLARSEVFQSSLRLARHVVAAPEARLLISNPVLSCPINIGINLFGEELLDALLERPAAARHALRVITDAIAACMEAFGRVIPFELRRNSVGNDRYAPAGVGFIDGCATQLVSARHYAEFFAPLDAELLGRFPRGGMIHLCGAHAQHIPIWREMRALKAVQLNDRAAEDFEAFHRGLREDQLVYVAPTERMTAARILEISVGRRVVLQCPAP